ncbi:hypothetical protein BO99DRAFT_82951 [Aspergillus violaceofuscus CBS 115571]|uniref:Uncharacterized protein n=1 Tax=Aspergillus violaceofuscus (strain CBS 115571) TaxID=1450538 RepID=A0A2V5HA82_ASPV1|nr:hypothetical protein BO99DRAFT_82951 [Aspergillus violaceofuscus CBS 115571]
MVRFAVTGNPVPRFKLGPGRPAVLIFLNIFLFFGGSRYPCCMGNRPRYHTYRTRISRSAKRGQTGLTAPLADGKQPVGSRTLGLPCMYCTCMYIQYLTCAISKLDRLLCKLVIDERFCAFWSAIGVF